jgi:ribonuclease P protein component
MESSRSNTLGKTDRLKSRKQIEMLFKSGKKITLFPFRLLYRIEALNGKIEAGFTVSAKNFPKAVDRNRIKRLTRESYRVQNKELKTRFLINRKLAYLFFIYTSREILSYEEISLSIKGILDKLIQMTNEENASNP